MVSIIDFHRFPFCSRPGIAKSFYHALGVHLLALACTKRQVIMSVLVATSVGNLTIDLFLDEAASACENFLKLCKAKYYHGNLFWSVQANFIAQTGDPTGSGSGGASIWGMIQQAKQGPAAGDAPFRDELSSKRQLNHVGLVCMSHPEGEADANRSQFFITLRNDGFEHLHGKHTVFGEVAEGADTLKAINLISV